MTNFVVRKKSTHFNLFTSALQQNHGFKMINYYIYLFDLGEFLLRKIPFASARTRKINKGCEEEGGPWIAGLPKQGVALSYIGSLATLLL